MFVFTCCYLYLNIKYLKNDNIFCGVTLVGEIGVVEMISLSESNNNWLQIQQSIACLVAPLLDRNGTLQSGINRAPLSAYSDQTNQKPQSCISRGTSYSQRSFENVEKHAGEQDESKQ